MWPWIPPFESQQVDGLCRLAGDLGALAEIVEAVRGSGVDLDPDEELESYVLKCSSLSPGLPSGAIEWLSDSATEPPASPAQITTLRRTIARINTVLHERQKAIGGTAYRAPTNTSNPGGMPLDAAFASVSAM